MSALTSPFSRAVALPFGISLTGPLIGVLVLCLACVARLNGIDQYVTVDEDLTLGRTGGFAEGLATGRWQRTYQVGHPEVTVMWIATAALGPTWAREFAGTVAFDGRVNRSREAVDEPTYMAALVRSRQGMAVVHSLLLAGAALLLWRLAGPAAGLVGGAMLALEPFLVAHGQVLRADALLAELMLVTLLAAVAYWFSGAGNWALLITGLATGLALLTKTPALALAPIVGIMALASRGRWPAIALWLSAAGLVYLALWPAMWVRPIETIERVIEYTLAKGGSPMDSGSFLLGRAAPDPGPLFYLVALGLRLSPAVLVGLLALAWSRGTNALASPLPAGGNEGGLSLLASDRQRRPAGRLIVSLFLAALLFGLVMTLAPKKADRYLLPLIPLLVALAGLGLAELTVRWRRTGPAAAAAVVALGQVAGLLSVSPYAMAYYDPLVGGGATASRAMLVGWGEGLDQVARTLNQDPAAPWRTAAVFYPEALDAQFAGHAVPLDDYDAANYAVLYIASDQRQLTPPSLAQSIVGRDPEFEVNLNGIRYARVYRLPDPEFADGLVLEMIRLEEQVLERGETVRLSLRWVVGEPRPEGVRTRILLMGDEGVAAESIGALHAGPLEAGQVLEERHRFAAPRRLGRYDVAVSLESESSDLPLPVVRRPPGLEPSPTRLIFRSLWIRVS